MKVTLTHIGAVSLGRLLAIWSFVFGLIVFILTGLFYMVAILLGIAASDNPVQMFGGGIVGGILFFGSGIIALLVGSVMAFIIGVILATIYNIILGVGGGIDLDLENRK